jgi:hypothetical protein
VTILIPVILPEIFMDKTFIAILHLSIRTEENISKGMGMAAIIIKSD